MAKSRYETAADKQRAYRERQKAKLSAIQQQNERAALAEKMFSIVEERAVTLLSHLAKKTNPYFEADTLTEFIKWRAGHEMGLVNPIVFHYLLETGQLEFSHTIPYAKVFKIKGMNHGNG